MATHIKFMKNVKFKDAVLLTGLPGIGLVGKIAVDYIIRQLKPEKIAEIHADFFPPSVQTTNGIVELIKDELHYLNFNGRDFIFLSGPVQPALDGRGSMEEHFEFSHVIIKSLKERGLDELCTLAGINVGEKRMQAEPRVVVAATGKKKLDEWVKVGAVSDKPVGLISGVAGLLLGLGKEEGIDGSCLMGETNARLVYGDPGAAKAIIELLIKKYGFSVEMKEMEKEAKEIEKAFAQLSKQIDEPEEHPQNLTYVR
ncbi:PAC2 family protein [uncultured archaeon]|nr:PAC2 family protein [uncultured archaeon]